MRAFDLVVFDIGGVLIRIATSWEESHRLSGVAGPVPADPAFHAALAALTRADGTLQADVFCERVAAASGGRYSVEDVHRISHAVLREEYPGVVDVIDALHDAGLETAILSNTNDGHWARLAPASGTPEYPSVLRARVPRVASFPARVPSVPCGGEQGEQGLGGVERGGRGFTGPSLVRVTCGPYTRPSVLRVNGRPP